MNSTTANTRSSSLQYGVLFGVIMVIEFFVGYFLKIDPQTNKGFGIVINLLNYLVLPLLFIVLAINDFKKSNNSFMSLGQALKIGVTICVVAALLYGVFYSLFYYLLPEYFDEMLRKMRSIILEKNSQMTSEQMNMTMSITKKFMAPIFAVPIVIIMFAFIGLVYSLICGLIMRKEPNQSF